MTASAAFADALTARLSQGGKDDDDLYLEPRGEIACKGKGLLLAYFLRSKAADAAAAVHSTLTPAMLKVCDISMLK